MNLESITQIGDYPVKRFIASGATADVFEVDDPNLEGADAIRTLKLLKATACSKSEFDHFCEEAALLAPLDNHHIVNVFDFGHDEATGRYYYTTTCIDGPTLAEEIEAQGALTPNRVIEIFSAALSGLVALHTHEPRLVHRDINPSNLLSHSDGGVRLSEIGVVRGHDSAQETQASFAVGTVRFMSPEQARGQDLDVRSDIFSLGLSMFEALAGRGIYENVEGVDPNNDFDVLGYLASCARDGSELAVDFGEAQVPAGLADVVVKACRFDPDDRYADAREMHAALVASVAPSDVTPEFHIHRGKVVPSEIRQIGHYEVRRFIDEGGMAWVFEVVDSRFKGHDVVRALKLLKPAAAAGEEFERFRREATMLAGFDHPNLVTIFDFGQDETTGCFYYTMTYVDGMNLAQQIGEQGPLDEKRAIEVFSSVLAGLAELHSHPNRIIHRDIKLANVLSHADGHIRLADLGIARAQEAERNTRTGFAVGTVRYMSPEQARGRSVDSTSDVFSVGLALYEALVSQNVYEGLDGIDSTSDFDVLGYLAMCGRSGEELEIDFENPRISPALTEVIRKACRYESSERYADATEMRAALLNLPNGGTPREIRKGEPSGADAKRRNRIGLAAAAGLTLALATWYFWPGAQARSEQQVNQAARTAESLAYLRKHVVDVGVVIPTDLLRRFDETTDHAQRGMSLSRANLAAGEWEAARISALDASEEMDAICRELGVMLPPDDGLVGQLDQKIESIKALGAAQHAAAKWATVQQGYQSLTERPAVVGATGCVSNHTWLARRPMLLSTLASASALEAELQRTPPVPGQSPATGRTGEPSGQQAVGSTRETARVLREKALRIGAHQTVKPIFDQAESEYEAGTTARYSKRFEEAIEHYGRAIPLYERAIADSSGGDGADFQPDRQVDEDVDASIEEQDDEQIDDPIEEQAVTVPDATLLAVQVELKALTSELRFCDGLKSAESVSQCAVARDELSKASSAAESRAPDEALDHVAASRNALKAALRNETAAR